MVRPNLEVAVEAASVGGRKRFGVINVAVLEQAGGVLEGLDAIAKFLAVHAVGGAEVESLRGEEPLPALNEPFSALAAEDVHWSVSRHPSGGNASGGPQEQPHWASCESG